MTSRPVRIAIDARPLAGPACGYTVYLGSILQCLRDPGFELTLLSNAPLLPAYEEAAGIETRVFGSPGNLLWEQRDLPRHLGTGGYDLYFSGANRGIPLRKARGTRYLLGLLDIIPYLFPRDYYLRRWKTLLLHPGANTETLAQLLAIARADAILTISQQSARDIRRIFGRRKNVTARLIRLKHAHRQPNATPDPRFVYVGGLDARKKVDVLLRGFALFGREHPDHRLMLIGSNYAALDLLIADLGIADRIDFTGYVDDGTKMRLLSRSLAMVYPSRYEGYGLAIAEGFQAGIPVIAGTGGAQAEVGGSGVRPIDPMDPRAIAAAMAEMTSDTARTAWIRRGEEQLARLTDVAIERDTRTWFSEQARLARAG